MTSCACPSGLEKLTPPKVVQHHIQVHLPSSCFSVALIGFPRIKMIDPTIWWLNAEPNMLRNSIFLLFEPSIPLNTTCDGFAPFQLLIMFEYGCEFVRRCGCGKGLECNDCSWDNSTMQGGSAEGDAPGMLGTQSNICPAWCCDRTVLHISTPERSNFQQLLQLSVPCMYSLSR